MSLTQPVTLSGQFGTLVPLSHAHKNDLIAAVKDGELWNLWYTAIPAPEGMEAEISRRLDLHKKAVMLPFAIIENATGQAVGMTTYMNIDALNRRLEIGSTWYRKRVQRSPLNTECKRLLLTHAFEQLDCIAVEFRTHFFNYQSRAAIERLGARLDGILRQHQITSNGTLRDTCVYSITSGEWPTVKAHLNYQLSKPKD
ncbi:GNAT family N-acetyltransferase [Glaciimonas immobilis]|uniref:RimJ/RimL family protein N-acetyltransferase n=1 Tax=Glaciimonas immobilis TaxID=728004 RepID=A0A840RVV4_9BURK|nr:GNAT family protein [Glaciimonas immobilis]KAF3996762.1 GNAT family N-acetyltransferase [Glaciimonas immobilis]MBB5201312.1 RimJ/RimL family protein N-acetyltransferase [Glaciimonas immobilis]